MLSYKENIQNSSILLEGIIIDDTISFRSYFEHTINLILETFESK